MNPLERKLHSALLPAIEGVTPGVTLQVHLRGRLRADLQIGKCYRFYDWASLTKIVFTVSQMMRAFEEKRVDLNKTVVNYLPDFPSPKVKIVHLLTHTAGFEPTYPFYLELKRQQPLFSWRELRGLLFERTSPKISSQSVYSCLGFLTLGLILQEVNEESLSDLWKSFSRKLGLEETHFHRHNRPVYDRKLYAPTSYSSWRSKILQGEVDDDNAWALGGVSTNAGLFGPIEDLSRWGLELRKGFVLGKRSRLGSPSTVRKFCRRATERKVGDWALGFMLPSKDFSSSGRLFSLRSVGHTGFTGTSLWLDPKRDLLVTILSNRVHPDRENTSFRALRPIIHNLIATSLK